MDKNWMISFVNSENRATKPIIKHK